MLEYCKMNGVLGLVAVVGMVVGLLTGGCELGQSTSDSDTETTAPAAEVNAQNDNNSDGATDEEIETETTPEVDEPETDPNEIPWCPEIKTSNIFNEIEGVCRTGTLWSGVDDGAARIRCDGVCTLSVYRVDESGMVKYISVEPNVVGVKVELQNLQFQGRIDFPLNPNTVVELKVDGHHDEFVARMLVIRGILQFATDMHEDGETVYKTVSDLTFVGPVKEPVTYTFDVVPVYNN